MPHHCETNGENPVRPNTLALQDRMKNAMPVDFLLSIRATPTLSFRGIDS